MIRVTGIGGIFFKSENPPQLYEWYEKHLGIQRESHGQGASFYWREPQAADGAEPGPKGLTTWCIFPQTTKYFAASKASFMVNYRVDNLEALLEDLEIRNRNRTPPRRLRLRPVRLDHRPRRQPHRVMGTAKAKRRLTVGPANPLHFGRVKPGFTESWRKGDLNL
jgi:hypothetical protein